MEFYPRIGTIEMIRVLQSRLFIISVSHGGSVSSCWCLSHELDVLVRVNCILLAPLCQLVEVDAFSIYRPINSNISYNNSNAKR